MMSGEAFGKAPGTSRIIVRNIPKHLKEARMKDHGMRTAAAKVQSDRLRRNTPTPDIVFNATAATRAGVASGGGGGGGGVEETAKQRKKRCVRSTTVIAFRANPSHHLTCSP